MTTGEIGDFKITARVSVHHCLVDHFMPYVRNYKQQLS